MDSGCDRPKDLGGAGDGRAVKKKRAFTILRDVETKDACFGQLILRSEGRRLVLFTLELPWRENKKQRSCIPVGTYDCTIIPERRRIALHDVPGRDGIQIHIGNFPQDSTGCILVGKSRSIKNAAVWASSSALEVLLEEIKRRKLESGFRLRIKECLPLRQLRLQNLNTKR